jgi:hypothetical protein
MVNQYDLESKVVKWQIRKTEASYCLTEFSVESLKMWSDENNIKLNTDGSQMTEREQSHVIELMLLGMPLPLIFVSYDDWEDAHTHPYAFKVVEGSHLIEAIVAFIDSKFRLVDMVKLKDFEGMTYSDLPLRVKRFLLLYTCRIIRFEDVSYDLTTIIDRVYKRKSVSPEIIPSVG